jgi:hypothetical protein
MFVTLLLSACTLSRTAPTPVPTRDAPIVEFQQPTQGATIVEGSELEILIVARDTGSGVARVDLRVDDIFHQAGMPQEGITEPIFSVLMNWRAQGVGLHSLTAIAYRDDGTPSDEVTIVIEVLPRGTPPAATSEATP